MKTPGPGGYVTEVDPRLETPKGPLQVLSSKPAPQTGKAAS